MRAATTSLEPKAERPSDAPLHPPGTGSPRRKPSSADARIKADPIRRSDRLFVVDRLPYSLPRNTPWITSSRAGRILPKAGLSLSLLQIAAAGLAAAKSLQAGLAVHQCRHDVAMGRLTCLGVGQEHHVAVLDAFLAAVHRIAGHPQREFPLAAPARILGRDRDVFRRLRRRRSARMSRRNRAKKRHHHPRSRRRERHDLRAGPAVAPPTHARRAVVCRATWPAARAGCAPSSRDAVRPVLQRRSFRERPPGRPPSACALR